MKKISEKTKVTLTLRQIKKLVKESISPVADMYDLYRACKEEPNYCVAVMADGEEKTIPMVGRTSISAIASAVRRGEIDYVIKFGRDEKFVRIPHIKEASWEPETDMGFDDDETKIIRVTNIDWDIEDEEHWDDDQPFDDDDLIDDPHWDDDQIDDSELTDDEKNDKFAELGLPTMDEVVEVPVSIDWTEETDDGEVADWLSDNYDFCVNGWTLATEK